MKQLKLGIGFYPTTVGLIDDSEQYIDKLISRLAGKEQLPCIVYKNPEEALHFLTNQYQSDSFVNRCLLSKEADDFDRLIVELNITAIQREIYNPHRFNEISVLIVDYAMPSINGLELCRLVRKSNPYIKIIMVTGEVGKSLAVTAFNEGSIDQFILKTTPKVMDVLVQAVRKFQEDYFLELSEMALNKIAEFSKQTLGCLQDSIFVDFFKQLCKTNRIVEYFLVDKYGSFLMLDFQGNPSVLAVADEDLMLTYGNLAEDDQAPSAIIACLKAKEMMPYFHTQEDFAVRPAEWKNYLHPVKVLQGKEIYYYSHITDPAICKIDQNKIVSYQKFLEAHLRDQES